MISLFSVLQLKACVNNQITSNISIFSKYLSGHCLLKAKTRQRLDITVYSKPRQDSDLTLQFTQSQDNSATSHYNLPKPKTKIQSLERQIQKLIQDRSTSSTISDLSSSDGHRANGTMSAEVAAKSSLKLVEPILGVMHHELDRAVHSLQVLEGHYRQQQAQLDEIENQFRMQQQQLQLKDAALADLEMRLAAQEMARYDGTILWKVSGFEVKKREAISGQTTSLYSPAFYSGPVTLMMIDQNHKEHIVDAFKPDPASSSFKRPITEMNIASGCPLFLPLEKLHSRQYGYLRDDTIFVKIIVDTDGLDRFTEMNPGRFNAGYP